ncbi:hypothetical protein BGZ60DRAFT_566194 [Tricladium varicosporioides]|nr:hypothetical protein BGZ60DRAFT_566194 [Hymenoscyphus varicosporioides]
MVTTQNGKAKPISPLTSVEKSNEAVTPIKPKFESKTKAGTKRKSPDKSPEEKAEEKEMSPPKKRGRPPKVKKEQKTIEETIENGNTAGEKGELEHRSENKTVGDENSKEPLNDEDEKDGEGINGKNGNVKMLEESAEDEYEVEKNLQYDEKNSKSGQPATNNKETVGSIEKKVESEAAIWEPESEQKNTLNKVKSDDVSAKAAPKSKQDNKVTNITINDDSVIEDSTRSAAIPSSILEKGIIYFFFRGRVGIQDPQGIEDVARSYIVLRPLPLGAKIGEGPMQDDGNARLLALPKKMLPKSRQDRFLMFVEKTGMSIDEVREQFAGNEYATKTAGTSNTPAATPSAEGIYAITSTGRESHLAYHITVPQDIGEVQKELGINSKGSFVLSTKNPEAPGPANATFSNPAKYPEEVQKKFRGLRWMPTEPGHLEYESTQFLVIGDGINGFGGAVEEMSKDKKDRNKEKPVDEVEKLGEEDHARVDGLEENDPVFADLGLSSKEYPHLRTTW